MTKGSLSHEVYRSERRITELHLMKGEGAMVAAKAVAGAGATALAAVMAAQVVLSTDL